MTFWLPNRIMQAAAFACVAASALVIWLALAQPWLGLTLASDSGPSPVRIVAVDPAGPARALAGATHLVALGRPGDPAPAVPLVASDVMEEPDMLETYAEIRAFMERQSQLAALLRGKAVTLHAAGGAGPAAATVEPRRRPVGSLPAAFWVQLVTGAGSLMIGAWVLALRPRDRATRLFAFTGAMICLSAHAAAVYSTRELAIDGGLFRALSIFNHAGALGFGVGMIMLFLWHPRPLVPAWVLLVVPAVVAPIFIADSLHAAPSPSFGTHLVVMAEMLLIVALIGVQWFVGRGDPRARAALRWLGTAVIVGAGAFVALIVAPILAESAPVMQQGYAFGFFLLIYAGLALGVSRYRLFDLDEWSFRIMFYTVGLLALIAIDALLILVLQLHRDTSFGLALLAVVFVYLPLRGWLWERLVARRRVESHELFRAVIDVSFATQASERSERWRALLKRLFDPLAIEPAPVPAADIAVGQDGLQVTLPAVADTPPLLLRYPFRGQRLFGTVHLQLARELVRLMRQAEESRNAYERGRAEERRRIARDLHDDVGARLLSGLHKTGVDDTHRVLRDAIADIRTIVSGLSAERLPLGQVVAALRHETGERLETAGIELSWPPGDGDDDPTALDYRVYRGLISIHREIVSNVIRHAGARRVAVRVRRDGAFLVMTVTDDGRGLAPDALAAPSSNGLRGMVRRAEELGGSLALVPGAGTAIEIRLPAVAAADASSRAAE